MSSVVRHSRAVRITHWLTAVSGILLLFSGFGQLPMYKRYNLVMVPGFSWSSNYEITLLIHYLSAVVFTSVIIFHLLYHLRRQEFAIMPKKGDVRASLQGLMAMFGLAQEPLHEKFQAKQRIIYAIIGTTSLILIATGMIKSYKNLGPIILDPLFLQWVAFTHTLSGMFFMILFVAHVAALMLKGHRPLIPSMISGKLDREYARQHHPLWHTE